MRIIPGFCMLLLVACNSGGDGKPVPGDAAGENEQPPTPVVTTVITTSLSATQLPPSLKFRGQVQEALGWKDNLGENILVLSIVPSYAATQKGSDDEDSRSAELHAFQYVKKDTGYKLLWKISDAEKLCPLDLSVEFLKNATAVTDLDGDGVAETTIQYKLACRGDVSPAYMKLIMHEDTAKYTLRGSMWVQTGEKDSFAVKEGDMDLEKLQVKKDEYEDMLQRFGRYETEKEFASAPPSFLEFARKQWLRFAKETFE